MNPSKWGHTGNHQSFPDNSRTVGKCHRKWPYVLWYRPQNLARDATAETKNWEGTPVAMKKVKKGIGFGVLTELPLLGAENHKHEHLK